jgi:hypothetical protein
MSITRVFPLFSAVFVVTYAFAVYFNLALFTYHPQLNEFAWLVEPPRAGPAMYWYGWILTSALVAAVMSVLALAVPSRWTARIWAGWTWLIPILVIGFFVYLLRNYFLR